MSLRDIESRPLGFYDVGAQLRDHVYARSNAAFAAGEARKDGLRNADELRHYQAHIRAAFLDGIGGLPTGDFPATPAARVVGRVAGDGFDVEKIIYQSRPHVYVTANLYLPHGLKAPSAAVLFVCGHHATAKHTPEYQIVCQIMARAGLIVLAQDPIGQGERYSYFEPALGDVAVRPCVADHDQAGPQVALAGGSLARYFLHDSMRAVDYLISRSEVDASRIGITGNSGGGTQASLMMLADRRLAAAAPATFIMSRKSYQLCGQAQDAEQIWPGFTGAGLDHEDIILALTPKPVCVLAVTSDFFPIEGTRRTVQRARRVYDMLGATDSLQLVEDQCRHHYTPMMAQQAAAFFARHLLGRTIDPGTLEGRPIEERKLWCTTSGQVRGEIADALTPFDENRAHCRRLIEQRQAQPVAARLASATEWLRQHVISDRVAVDGVLRLYTDPEMHDGLRVEPALWWTQADMLGHGLLFRQAERKGQQLPVTLAVWDGGTRTCSAHAAWIHETCRGGRAVLVVDVSGVGALTPHPTTTNGSMDAAYGTLHKLADDLTFLGDSLAGLRTWDVLQAVAACRKWPGLSSEDTHLYAHGRLGLYARLAAVLEASVTHIDVAGDADKFQDITEHRYYDPQRIKAILLNGVLRQFDTDDLSAMRKKN